MPRQTTHKLAMLFKRSLAHQRICAIAKAVSRENGDVQKWRPRVPIFTGEWGLESP